MTTDHDPNETAAPDLGRPDADAQRRIDALGKRAGAELRHSAPSDGIATLERRAGQHRTRLAAAVAGCTALIVAAALVIAHRANGSKTNDVGLGVPATASATTATSPGVATSYTATYPSTLTPEPSVCTPSTELCIFVFPPVSVPVIGDWVGTMVAASVNSTDGTHGISTAHLVFEGTIAPCGNGTVWLNSTSVGSSNPTVAVGKEIATDSFRWQIVPDTGRGDLIGLTGSGTVTALFTGTEVKGTYSGTIVCGKH
jgi:hypothetical protein